jgi:holin-like protein
LVRIDDSEEEGTMDMYRGLAIILGFLFTGQAVSKFTHIPVPGSVLGMIFLTAALMTGMVKLEHVEEVGTFLIKNMSVMFIPPGVGVVVYWSLVKKDILPISVALLVSFALTIVLTAKVVELIRSRENG